MATAGCVSSAGVWSFATPIKHGVGSCSTFCGVNSASSRTAWAGARAPRKSGDWLPRPDEVWVDQKTGRPTPRFFQFVREIAEVRLGGVQGKSVPEVHADVVQTQATATATVSYATQLGQYTQGVAATAAATLLLLMDNDEPAAEPVPPPPAEVPEYTPPPKPPGKPGSEEP
jgi:hypothetical protein